MTTEAPEQVARPRGGAAGSSMLLLALALVGAGCDRGEVQHFRVPKEAAPAAGDMTGTRAMPASAEVAPPPAPTGGETLRWTLPVGWTEQASAGGMRFATLTPREPGVDVSVTVLPGPAGGELANVNRWRNQIGLPPLDDAALAASRKIVASKAGPISLYDFTAEGAKRSRVVAGFTVSGGNTWFVKMSGEAKAVQGARPAFVKLMESLRFDASHP
jgi:hypothetical protein